MMIYKNIIIHTIFISLFILTVVLLPSYAQILTQSILLYKHDASREIVQQYFVVTYKFIDLIHIIAKSPPASFDKLQAVFNKKFAIKENSKLVFIY